MTPLDNMAYPYDLSLLAAAPASTRPQLEERCDHELPRISTIAPTPLTSSTLPVDKERGHLIPTPPSSKPSFWHTTKGIVILFLAALIIIGAIFGGAVGGTVGRNSLSSSSKEDGNDSSSPSLGNGSNETSEARTVQVVTITLEQRVRTITFDDGQVQTTLYPLDTSSYTTVKTTIGPDFGGDPSGDIPFATTITFDSGITSTIAGDFPAVTEGLPGYRSLPPARR